MLTSTIPGEQQGDVACPLHVLVHIKCPRYAPSMPIPRKEQHVPGNNRLKFTANIDQQVQSELNLVA